MNEKPTYYSIIPADVRYDKTLTPMAKLLYSELTCLSNAFGFCTAGNKYFADLYELSEREIRRIIHALKEKGYIQIDSASRPRKIYVNYNGTKMSAYEDKNVRLQEHKNVPHNNTSININNNIYNITPEIELPLKDGTTFHVTEEVMQHYKELYPPLDITAEFKKMHEWLNNNPNRRKKDICRFINNWLSSASKKTSACTDNGYTYSNTSDKADSDRLKAVIENGYY